MNHSALIARLHELSAKLDSVIQFGTASVAGEHLVKSLKGGIQKFPSGLDAAGLAARMQKRGVKARSAIRQIDGMSHHVVVVGNPGHPGARIL